jgi:hypothetical protein
VKRILKPLIVAIAAVYFLADAIFATLSHPLSRWIGELRVLASLRSWIRSLRPYPSLALFAVPLIVLEPVKPVAAYLAATGHVRPGLMVLIVGEILKLVLVERLFSINRDKLLSIPAFAWAYGKYRFVVDWLESSEAWQMVLRWNRRMRLTIRARLSVLKASSALMSARRPLRNRSHRGETSAASMDHQLRVKRQRVRVHQRR